MSTQWFNTDTCWTNQIRGAGNGVVLLRCEERHIHSFPILVQLSIVSEMYSLNALICVVILWALSRNQWRWTILAFFLFGLGLNNHPTLVFLGPGLALFAWRTLPPVSRLEKSAALLKLSLWAALGWTLVLYVPIRSFQNPAIDWGNPETLRNLWRLITRSDYGGLRLHPEQSQFIWTAGAGGVAYHTFRFTDAGATLNDWIAHGDPEDTEPYPDSPSDHDQFYITDMDEPYDGGPALHHVETEVDTTSVGQFTYTHTLDFTFAE